MVSFKSKLVACVKKNNSLVCVGLDSDLAKLPLHLANANGPQFEFNKAIVDATADLVCAYKPNSAFYEANGAIGIEQLKKTCDYIRSNYPNIPVILDAKRADIGNTNLGYAAFAFDYLAVDAITVHPYLGREAVEPFLKHADRGIIVLCRTSNPGAGEFQDLEVREKKLYQIVAEQVKDEWNKNNNCLLVVGATYPAELAEIRKLMGEDFIFLVPGIGSQGGDIEKTVTAGVNQNGEGIIVSSSREIIFASSNDDFSEVARKQTEKLRDIINKIRRKLNDR